MKRFVFIHLNVLPVLTILSSGMLISFQGLSCFLVTHCPSRSQLLAIHFYLSLFYLHSPSTSSHRSQASLIYFSDAFLLRDTSFFKMNIEFSARNTPVPNQVEALYTVVLGACCSQRYKNTSLFHQIVGQGSSVTKVTGYQLESGQGQGFRPCCPVFRWFWDPPNLHPLHNKCLCPWNILIRA